MLSQNYPVLMRQVLLAAVLTLGLGLPPLAFSQNSVTADPQAIQAQAQVLLRQGRAEDAFKLLEPYEARWAGNAEYDYLLGVSALDSQRPGRAIFSLQRLVARQPDFAGARLELARAYFDIGDNELARDEFKRVLAQDPPANVLAAVSNYQEAIEARATAYTPSTEYYVEFGGGHDTNAPAATDEQLFLGFQLNPRNLEQASEFFNVAVGGAYSRPLSASSQLQVTGRLDHRSNFSAHFVDTSNLNLGVAWNWREGDNGFSLAANGLVSSLDGDYNRRDTSAVASYLRQLSKTLQLSGFVKFGLSRFEQPALVVRDVDQVSYGVSVVQSFARSQLNLVVSSLEDDAVQDGSPFSSDGYDVRLTNIWFQSGGKQYFLEAGYLDQDYDSAFFGFSREDEVTSLTAGTVWPSFPAKDWVTSAWLGYKDKKSTVGLFEFERIEALVSFRRLIK